MNNLCKPGTRIAKIYILISFLTKQVHTFILIKNNIWKYIFLAKILEIWNFAKRQNFVVSSHFRKQEKISPNLENKPVLQGHRGSQ